MNKLLLSVSVLIISCSIVQSQNLSEPKLNNNPIVKNDFKPYAKDIEKRSLKEKNPFFNLDLNLQVGALVSTTKFDPATTNDTTSNYENTKSKVGPTAGLTLSIDVLGFGITTGFVYDSKGFKVVQPGTTSEDKVNLNFLDIPLLFHFDFDLGRILIDGNVGPYFGLLTSGGDETSFYNIKNFDLGLTGNLQFAYMFNKYLGAILGTKFEYGGLNNLGSNSFFNSIRTQSYHFYTGMKFQL